MILVLYFSPLLLAAGGWPGVCSQCCIQNSVSTITAIADSEFVVGPNKTQNAFIIIVIIFLLN